ncbi:MAG: xylulokinase [Candidatus Atribacteria bacterium]|nr:xylulokinase [Candidatus Atribacteria bacterium]
MSYILSADFGTSSLKISLLDYNLNLIKSAKANYTYEVKKGKEVEIAPEILLQAFKKGVKILGQEHTNKIEYVVCDTLCPSLIAMDREGNPLYPAILHLDRRSTKQARKALQAVGKDTFLKINGNLPFPGGISLTSILWIKENYPDLYQKTQVFGHFNTFLQKFMVGKFFIDPTHASFTGLYETLEWGGWSKELCKGLDIDASKLPEIADSNQITGGLKKEAARFLGLREGIPVLMGANDTATAALGAGATEEGQILNISGSNEIITVTLEKPLPHEKVYLRTHAVRNRWLLLAITVGGGALEWFRREFYREMSREEFYEKHFPEVVKRAGKPRVRFYPYLAGDRHSINQRRARFSNLTLDTTREEMLCALLFGIFEPINLVLSIYRNQVKFKKEVALTGGMVNEAFLEFKKRVFPDFVFKNVQECVAIGNGKLALSGKS